MDVSDSEHRQKTVHERGWPLVLLAIAGLALGGWTYLGAMVADMVPVMDMSTAGPGMGLFNRFNLFHDLSPEARAALSVICLPAGVTTFGMPGAELGLPDLLKIFLMWLMMALAMMLPSALPMLRAYHQRQGVPGRAGAAADTLLVAAGYLLVWGGYAAVATLVQWAMSQLGTLNDMLAPASLALSASVLLAAGLYQFTRAKRTCLQRCWYPRFVFSLPAGGGAAAASFREGIVQGWICLGCCWAVMTVMFAVGLMNVLWIALLGALMAVEKALPNRYLTPAIGVVFLAWGGGLAAAIVSNAG